MTFVTITPGQSLLHYRIVEKVGEGGMGVVWKAVDETLGREVAIKVLPESPAASAEGERLARFEREAKLLASLNHPNIAAVFGLHEADGVRFIAMELVDGSDLAERLREGPLSLAEALGFARQVASALAAAHDSGVIHRDLKPANIRVTPDGRVKVLDFGLAKAFDVAAVSGSVHPSMSPTVTSAGTRVGVILGTPSYMSPEQSRGKPVDRRADIWAFGCVLYEMLSSRQAFGGETVTDVLAAILKNDVDFAPLAGRAPRRLVRLLERCLEKDPQKRLRDAGDIGLEIDAVLAAGPDAAGESSGFGTRARWLSALVVVVALAAGIALGRSFFSGGFDGSGEVRRWTVSSGDGRVIRWARISGNGEFLTMGLDDGAYVRRLDRYELMPVPDSKRLRGWAESPDGTSAIFFAIDDDIMGSGKLRRVSLDTGITATLQSSLQTLSPVWWDEDGLVTTYSEKKLARLRDETAEPEVLVTVEHGHFHSARLVRGTHAVLLGMHNSGGSDEWNLEIADLDSGESHPLLTDAREGLVTTNGYLLFLRDSSLLASRFDRRSLRAVGEIVPVLAGVRDFSVSDDGTLAYIAIAEDERRDRVVRVSFDGTETVLFEGNVSHLRYAPNGRWVSIVTAANPMNLVDVETGSVRPLSNSGYRFADQVWRPDGKAIVYTGISLEGDRNVLFEHPLDGGDPRSLLESDTSEAEIYPTGYAPDGSGLLYARYGQSDTDLWWLPADGSEPRPVLETKASEDLARFSPDGRWVAYESNETGRQEVWAAVYDKDRIRFAEKWQISRNGGRDPLWSPDGETLYFESFDEKLIGVDVRVRDGQLSFGERRVVFDLNELGANAQGDESYDVAPSGDHIVLVQGSGTGTAEVRVVSNWFDELERLFRTED